MSADCFFINVGGQALTWFHLFPTFIFLGLWAGSLRPDGTRVGVIFFYSLYLTMWNMALWALQVNFALLRPHELCGHLYTYAFPSIESFLFGNLVAVFVGYAYYRSIQIGWQNWIIIYGTAVFPQAFLVLVGYNRWWEVLISFVLGLLSSLFFVSVIFLYIKPYIPFMETQAPFTWLHLKDHNYVVNHADKHLVKEIAHEVEECEKCIRKAKNTRVDSHGSLKRGW